MTVQSHLRENRVIPPHPVVSGCYILFKDRVLTYVGKSRDVYGRIDAHRTNGRAFDYATVVACPESDAGWIEAALIRGMRPPENKALQPKQEKRRELIPLEKPKTDVLPADDDMVVSRPRAIDYARHYKLSSTLLNASIASGELPSAVRNRSVLIKAGDLRAWCKRHVAI